MGRHPVHRLRRRAPPGLLRLLLRSRPRHGPPRAARPPAPGGRRARPAPSRPPRRDDLSKLVWSVTRGAVSQKRRAARAATRPARPARATPAGPPPPLGASRRSTGSSPATAARASATSRSTSASASSARSRSRSATSSSSRPRGTSGARPRRPGETTTARRAPRGRAGSRPAASASPAARNPRDPIVGEPPGRGRRRRERALPGRRGGDRGRRSRGDGPRTSSSRESVGLARARATCRVAVK